MSRKVFKISIVLTILLSLVINNVFGQHSAQFNQVKEKYPEAHLVRLQEETIINISRPLQGF